GESEYLTVYPTVAAVYDRRSLSRTEEPAVTDRRYKGHEERGRELIAQRAHVIDGIEDLALQILSGQLKAAGLLPDQHNRSDIGFYGRWLKESYGFLERGGYRNGAVDPSDAWKEWEAAKSVWNRDASKQATVALVEVCLRALPEILLGHQPATSVMFPNSSMA